MRLAITGSTGNLGRIVVDRLRRVLEPSSIVALARSADKASDLGVEYRLADYDRRETLDAALQGVDTVLLVSGSEVGRRLPQHRNVIDAAKANGVKRIVYTSLLHADRSPLSLAAEHKATERLLVDSGLRYTILRNGWYAENHTANVGAALEHGAVLGSAGDGRFSAAPRADYAEAAVRVLTTDGHDGAVYELSGDGAYTLAEYAAEVEKQAGKRVEYKNLPADDYAEALVGAGLTTELARAIAGWDADAAGGWLFDDGATLSTLIGRPTTPMSVSVRQALAYPSPADGRALCAV